MRRFVGPLLLSWIALLMGRFLYYHEVNDEAFGLASIVLDPTLVIFGITLLGLTLWAAHDRNLRWPSLGIRLVALALGFSLLSSDLGPDLGTYFRLWRNESTYLQAVETILAVNDENYEQFNWPIQVDKGPPVRVAFSWGGILDNWHGIVYDSTGEVGKAAHIKKDLSNWDDQAFSQVRMLFGGGVVYARHLWGNWYYCRFT